MIYNIPFFAVIILFAVGMSALIFKKNILKIAMGIVILQSSVNLFLITLGYRKDGVAPIFTHLPSGTEIPGGMVLPIPQALTLTSIVIGVAVLALILSFVIKLYHEYGTLDTNKMRRLKE